MEKVKTLRIKEADGTISQDVVDIAVDAINVEMANGETIQDTIGDIDINEDGDIAEQLKSVKQTAINISDLVNIKNELTTSEVTKGYANDSEYIVTPVPLYNSAGSANKWKLGIANDSRNAAVLETTSNFAYRHNASICINAGIFDNNTKSALGICIIDGEIVTNSLYNQEYGYTVLWIDSNNNIHFQNLSKTTTAQNLLDQGAVYAVQGFASLIHDSLITISASYPTTKEPRQIICQKADNSYFIVSILGRNLNNSAGMTYTEAANLCLSLGAKEAYALDGGGSVTTVVNGVRQNNLVDDIGTTEREVKTFLYISEIEQKINSNYLALREIQKLKQKMTEELTHLTNGVLKLQGAAAQMGIEFWENYSNQRAGKIAINDSNLVASMMIDAVNTVVLRADGTGISDKNGKLAHIYQLAPVLTDMNTLDTEVCTTMYRVRNDAQNLPVEDAYGVDFRMAYGNSNNIVELFYDMQHQRNFIRYFRSSTWQSWKEISLQDLDSTLWVRNSKTFDNGTGQQVPLVSTDGMINICDGQLRLYCDTDGDGDYDADIYSLDNMYLVCGNSTHIILGQDPEEQAEKYGRIVFASTTNTNFIQSGKNYSGTTLKHLAFAPYRSTDYYMIFNKDSGFCGVGKYYSSPQARLHVNSDEATLAVFENHSGINARISFKGTNQNDYNNATIGLAGNILVLRNNDTDKLRIDTGNYVLPGIASTTSLGSTVYPWKDIYSVNALTTTSDRRSKHDIEDINEKIFEAWDLIEYKQYKMNNDEEEKIHFGIIAQDIVEAFENVGLNALDYGLVEYDEENDIYNVRYAEVNIVENAYLRNKINK